MDEDVKARLKSGSLWTRAVFMVLFAIISVIARAVITLLAVVQFIVVMFTGRANEAMLELGNNLAKYVSEMVRFVTFNTEDKPFPFSPWPDEPIEANPWLDEGEAPPPEEPEIASVELPNASAPEAPTPPSDTPTDDDRPSGEERRAV